MSTPKDLEDLTAAMRLLGGVQSKVETASLPRQLQLDLVSAHSLIAATHTRLVSEQKAQKKADAAAAKIIHPSEKL